MDKLLEVREFDSITGNADYKDQGNYKYLPGEIFDDLIRFIHEFSGDEKNSDVLDFLRVGYKRNIGELVTIKNYVGLIQMRNGYQIQVLPKISLGSEDAENSQTKSIFIKMLRSMKDFPGKVFNQASLRMDRMNLYEIFINMYLQEVRQLVKHGLKSAYVEEEDNLRFFKGKLQVSQHIRSNVAHRERFYVTYDKFHPNRPENRLVKSTLLKLQKITGSAENAKEIRQLLGSFEIVVPSTNYQKDFLGVKVDRSMQDYEMLMPWSQVFLMNKSFTTFSGNNQARALLFPMEKVFESYVAQQMKKILGPKGWTVSSQDRGYYLFDEPRKLFSLRPDLVLEKDGRIIILDTKWKNLSAKERNYGISQDDMYQMYAYSKKYDTSEIWLLYPTNDEMRQFEKDIVFKSGDGTNVHVFFIDLEDIGSSLLSLNEKLEKAGWPLSEDGSRGEILTEVQLS